MESDQQTPAAGLEVERAVTERYSEAAGRREESLCCPVDYDARWLEAIPEEIIAKDYGCGDPSRYVREGDVVLDLGSGAGKICFIAAQIAGPEGRVIGVDMNDEMLEVARRSAPEVARSTGTEAVQFHKGRIQDLALDLDLLDTWLKENPVRGASDLSALDDRAGRLRAERPMIPDGTVDIVLSNCVLNLVRDSDKSQMIREIFRVLRRGGRIAISDIVSDEPVPDELKRDPDLWSGCISGAFQEEEFLKELEDAGFYGIALDQWSDEPYAVVKGIEFRSVIVTASKGKEGPCLEANQAVIYKGPWSRVVDDDGHVLRRGERAAVCAKTYSILTSEPYAGDVVPVAPRETIAESDRKPFDRADATRRDPRETKGRDYGLTSDPDGSGSSDSCC